MGNIGVSHEYFAAVLEEYLAKERDACADLAIEVAEEFRDRGAPQYAVIRSSLGMQIAERIREGNIKRVHKKILSKQTGLCVP